MLTILTRKDSISNNVLPRRFTIGLNHKVVGKTAPETLSGKKAWGATTVTIEELTAHIGKGHPWMPSVLDGNGKRWQSNANYAEVLALDIDHGMSIEQFLANPWAKDCAACIESNSSTPEHNKFRPIFVLPGIIQNDKHGNCTFTRVQVPETSRIVERDGNQLSNGNGLAAKSNSCTLETNRDRTDSDQPREVCLSGLSVGGGDVSGCGDTRERITAGLGFGVVDGSRNDEAARNAGKNDQREWIALSSNSNDFSEGFVGKKSKEEQQVAKICEVIKTLKAWEVIRLLNLYLAHCVGNADPACKDPNRFFFGAFGRTPFLLNPNATLPLQFILDAIEWNAEKERKANQEWEERRAVFATIDIGEQAALAKEALEFISPYTPGGGTYNDLVAMMGGVLNDLGSEGANILEAWGGFGKETRKKIQGLERTPNKKATLAKLFKMAKQCGFRFPQKVFTEAERKEWGRQKRLEQRSAKHVAPKVAPKKDSISNSVNQFGANIFTFAGFDIGRKGPIIITRDKSTAERLLAQGANAVFVLGGWDKDLRGGLNVICKDKPVVIVENVFNNLPSNRLAAFNGVSAMADGIWGHKGILVAVGADLNNQVPIGDYNSKALGAWARGILAKHADPTDTPDITFNSRWVSEAGLKLPPLSSVLLIDSFMGSGKTQWMADVIQQLEGIHGDNLWVDAIGYRNGLLIQMCARLGITHMQDLGVNGVNVQDLRNNEPRMAYCINSFMRRVGGLKKAIGEGKKVLLILDELDNTMKTLLTSKLLEGKRAEIVLAFSELLQLIADGGGWVIGGEANLSQLAINSLRDLAVGTLPIVVAQNTAKPPQWTVNVVEVDGKSSTPTNMKKSVLAHIDAQRGTGKKIAFLSMSQGVAEQLDVHRTGKGDLIERVDSKTSASKSVKDLLADPNAEIATRKPDMLIGTPSMSTGVSIDIKYFDDVVSYSTNLEASETVQGLARVRDNSVVRTLFVSDKAAGHKNKKIDAVDILARWDRDSSEYEIKPSSYKAISDRTILDIAHALAADYLCRAEAGEQVHRERILTLLERDGHSINFVSACLDGTEGDSLKTSNETIIATEHKNYTEADDSSLTRDAAVLRMRDEITPEESIKCHKAIDRFKFDDLVNDPQWITEFVAEKGKAARARSAMLFATYYEHPELAKESDDRYHDYQKSRTGDNGWKGDFKARVKAVMLLKKLGFDAIPQGVVIHKNTPEVEAFFAACLEHREELAERHGINVQEDTNAMSVVNDMARNRLAYQSVRTSYYEDGKRKWGFVISEGDYRARMVEGHVKDAQHVKDAEHRRSKDKTPIDTFDNFDDEPDTDTFEFEISYDDLPIAC